MGLKKVERYHEDVPLFTNADRLHIQDLERDLEQAAVSAGPARKGDVPLESAVAAYDQFKAEALERATMVGMTALPGKEWRELLAAHPPRREVKDEEGEVTESWPQDEGAGCNVDTIARPLVIACLDLAQFDSDRDREEWVDDLSDPDFNRLTSDAFRLNSDAGPNPKWSASSWLDRTSFAMSRSAETSTEASASSSDSPSRIGDSSEPNG